jgi:seryl-tRNA synthetase
MLSNFFRSEELRDSYDKLMNMPQRMQLDSEQAMMRLMLMQLVKKIDSKKDVPIDLIAAITTMCEKISSITEKMSKMNEITPETIDRILNAVVDILVDYVPADKLEEATDKVQMLTQTKRVCSIPFEPGDTLKLVNGKSELITAEREEAILENATAPVHKVALAQAAQHLDEGEF